MKTFILFCQIVLLLLCRPARSIGEDASYRINDQLDVLTTDWPWWRGPNRDGIADRAQDPPVQWNANSNVLWKAKIPGRGHGSPIVCGDRVLLTTAANDEQLLLCFDRQTGKSIWKRTIHDGGLPKKLNKKASHASSTPAWDGQAYFVTFVSDGAAFVTRVTRDGNIDWQQRVTEYTVHQGYGASPFLYQSLVIVAADNKQSGLLAAFDRQTGERVWHRKRPNKPNYPTPTVLHVDDRDQLILTGTDLVTSLVPLTGELDWEIQGATTECVTSAVTDGTHIFTSGGYPDNHMSAVRADGSGEEVWRNRNRVYVPSMLVDDGYLYGVLDAGVASCWEAGSGRQMWKKRLGGTFSASPVLVRDRIYVTNESGETFIFGCRSDAFELIGKNKLGDSVFATPAICGSQIFTRVAFDRQGKREEMLFCLGNNGQVE